MLSILSYIVVVLTMTVGLSIFTSNRRKKGRFSALSLAIAYFGAAFWALFVQLFRSSTGEMDAHVFHQFFSVIALLTPIGCLLYAFSIYGRKVSSVVICTIAVLITVIIGYFIITDPASFYASIVLADGGNYAVLADTPLVMAYMSSFGIYLSIAVAMIFVKAYKTKNDERRKGLLCVGGGLMLSAGICLIFNVIMPVLGQYEMFLIGPLALAITMLFTYFATLKYKVFTNDSKMIQYSTYLVVVAMGAIIYTIIFYLVFMLVFRGASPSDEIITLQFVMVVIIILFLPTINHFIEYIKEMISDNVTTVSGGDNDGK